MSYFESELSLKVEPFESVVFEVKKFHSRDLIEFFKISFVKKNFFGWEISRKLEEFSFLQNNKVKKNSQNPEGPWESRGF